MAVVPGTVSLLAEPLGRLMSWDVLFVLGIPLGAFAALLDEAGPSQPRRFLQ